MRAANSSHTSLRRLLLPIFFAKTSHRVDTKPLFASRLSRLLSEDFRDPKEFSGGIISTDSIVARMSSDISFRHAGHSASCRSGAFGFGVYQTLDSAPQCLQTTHRVFAYSSIDIRQTPIKYDPLPHVGHRSMAGERVIHAQQLQVLFVVASHHGLDACGQFSLIGPICSDRSSNFSVGILPQSILKT